jgi:hypothetical protein
VLATLDSRWYEQNNALIEDHPQLYYDLIVISCQYKMNGQRNYTCGNVSNPGCVVYGIYDYNHVQPVINLRGEAYELSIPQDFTKRVWPQQ